LRVFVTKRVEFNNNITETNTNMLNFVYTSSGYEKMKEKLEKLSITINDIEDLSLEEENS